MGKMLPFLVHLAFVVTVSALSPAVVGQSAGKTIEGYWQDSARRILFARDAPSSYLYGRWTDLDLQETYPSAKQIRRSGAGFELVDLLYDEEEYTIRVVKAGEDSIEFVRTSKFPACAMHYACRLEGNELFCALEKICREGGRDVLDWKGEERYVRRASCERGTRREAQGIPHRCQ